MKLDSREISAKSEIEADRDTVSASEERLFVSSGSVCVCACVRVSV